MELEKQESKNRRKKCQTQEKGEQIGLFPVTEPERGSFPQEERGEGSMPKDSQVKEMKKQDNGQMRQPFSGDRVKHTAPFEDRQS